VLSGDFDISPFDNDQFSDFFATTLVADPLSFEILNITSSASVGILISVSPFIFAVDVNSAGFVYLITTSLLLSDSVLSLPEVYTTLATIFAPGFNVLPANKGTFILSFLSNSPSLATVVSPILLGCAGFDMSYSSTVVPLFTLFTVRLVAVDVAPSTVGVKGLTSKVTSNFSERFQFMASLSPAINT